MTKKKRLRERCKRLERLLAKERETNTECHRTTKEAVEVAELAAKRHKRHQRLVDKLYRKLGRANRKLEVANETVELLTEKWRFLNQLVAEMITTSEKRTFQNVMSTKALEMQLRQFGYQMPLDERSEKMLEATEEPNGNGKVKPFRRG